MVVSRELVGLHRKHETNFLNLHRRPRSGDEFTHPVAAFAQLLAVNLPAIKRGVFPDMMNLIQGAEFRIPESDQFAVLVLTNWLDLGLISLYTTRRLRKR